METRRLSDLISSGQEHPTPDLGEVTRRRDQLRRLMPTMRRTRTGRDALLSELIGHYRSGHREIWGSMLLEVMGAAVFTELERYRPQGPVFDSDDLAQQMLAEVLEAALVIPLPAGAQHLEQRLLCRVTKRMERLLRGELRRQRAQIAAPWENDGLYPPFALDRSLYADREPYLDADLLGDGWGPDLRCVDGAGFREGEQTASPSPRERKAGRKLQVDNRAAGFDA